MEIKLKINVDKILAETGITIEELRIYGMNRLNRGEIKGWYVETDGGEVIEKHTHVIC